MTIPRLTIRMCAAVSVLVALALALPSGAEAYRLAGARWPGRTITYFDGGPDHGAIRAAVRSWNASGVRIRFRAAPRSRARVVVARGGGICNGFAQIGYSPYVRRARVVIAPCPGQADAEAVAAHELGHILGLNHENRQRCSLMSATPHAHCTEPGPFEYRCRLIEADDLRGAIRRYGGRPRRTAGGDFCPTHDPPATPVGLVVTGGLGGGEDAFDTVELSFKQAESHARVRQHFDVQPGLTGEAFLFRDACPPGGPAGVPQEHVRLDPREGVQRIALAARSELRPGRYCVLLRTVDGLRRASGVATASFTVVKPPPTADFYTDPAPYTGQPTSFADSSRPGEVPIERYAWDFGDASSGASNTSGEPAPDHTYAQPGRYTVRLTVTDRDGQSSTATRDISVQP